MIQTLTTWLLRLPVLRSSAVARQFVKFGMVGVTNTIWDFGLYLLFTRGWLGFTLHFLAANFLAFVGSVINSYVLNKRWTFRHMDGRHHVYFAKFLAVNLVSLALYEGLLYLFIEKGGMFDLVAKACSIVIVLVWNFSANKMWTFRVTPGEQSPTV